MNPKNPKYKWRKAWSWPSDTEAKIKDLCEGFTLHVCAGDSSIGDVKIDLHQPSDVKADMFHLPIRTASFDTIICDPPWHLRYDFRHKLLYQLRDSLKPGGLLIFNSIWFPKIRGLQVEPELYVGVPNATWRNASLLITARRIALPLDLEQQGSL